MFPNWTGWKTVKLVLSGIAAAAGGVAAAHLGVVSDTANIVGTVDASVMALVVILSGTSAGPAVSK